METELNLRYAMSRDVLPVLKTEQAIYAMVEIKAGSGKPFGQMPANFALVLDRSGSMDGEKLARMKEAVGSVVDALRDNDLLSVVIFDDQVETIVPSRSVVNPAEIKTKVESMIARGGTQIADGLQAGLDEVKKSFSRDRVNRVLLLTDGRTWDDEERCLALADEAGTGGIAITSIGIGDDWNEKLLLGIAERSHGNSHWVQNPLAVLDVFREEVEGMQSVAATNLVLTARLSEGVRPVRVHTTVPMISDISARAIQGSSIAAELGSLDAGKGQVLLIEAHVAPRQDGRFRLGQIEMTYDVPAQGIKARTTREDLFVTFAADGGTARVNAEVMNLVEKLSAFKLQTRALTEAAAGNIASATKKLQSAATVLLNLGEGELAGAVEQEITMLRKTGSLSAAGTKKLEYGTRKLTKML